MKKGKREKRGRKEEEEKKGTERRGEGLEGEIGGKKWTAGEERGKKGGGYPCDIFLLNGSVPYLCHVLCHKVNGVGVQSYSNEAHQVWVSQGAVTM